MNTIPGMTAMSGFPRLWAASGVDGRALVEEIVRLGLERHERLAGSRWRGSAALPPRSPRPASFYSALPVRVGASCARTQSLSGGIIPRYVNA